MNAPEKSPEKPGQRRKLGRGLGALLGETNRDEPLNTAPGTAGAPLRNRSVATPETGLANLAISLIQPHPDQPRRHFDEDALDELAASISARGVIQPVIVRTRPGGRYQLVAGERRWRAAQKAQVHEIPALIRDLDDRDVMALALIENVQREDLNPVEEARAYQRLAELEDMTQAEIAELVDKSRSHVANLQRLLSLPTSVLDHVEAGRLDMGHARALIGRDNAAELAEMAIARGLTVREVEKLAKRPDGVDRKKSSDSAMRDSGTDADIAAVEKHLQEFLGLPVKISTEKDPRAGAVTIRYTNLDQLDLICQRLTGADI